MTRVLLADDHTLLRHALREALESADLEVVAEAADGEEAVRLAHETTPDVVVMDVTMPVLDGVEATRRITTEMPGTRVAVLTMHGEQRLLAEALRAGAVAFLGKDSAMSEVVEAVRAVAAGDIVLSPEIGASMLRELKSPETLGTSGGSPLTAREEEVLQLVADGRSTTEISEELFISAKTVKNHLASVYAKLDARDRTQAVLTAVRRGIISLHED
ncbi:MAG: response regulator transcription factor [Acidimicrobiia bacterium]|nr:response regulator transcription factor [Acidimicrobiia bacterium]